MASNFTTGLPRNQKVAFDQKLDPVEAEAFVEPEKPPVRDWRFLRYIGIVVSVFASFVTAVNSYEWFAALRPWWVALPMAVTMIGASVFLPDFGILLWLEKKKALGGAIFLAGVLSTLFCMVTTVAAFYNTHTWRTADASDIRDSGIALQQTLDERVKDRERIIGQMSIQDDLIKQTQQKIDLLTPQETLGGISQTLQNRLLSYIRTRQALDGEIQVANSTIEELRSAIRDNNNSDKTRGRDFYSFIASVFKGDPTTVEFLTATVPAVFLEIVAPVMVAVVIFL